LTIGIWNSRLPVLPVFREESTFVSPSFPNPH
jgi:hypothetical protein